MNHRGVVRAGNGVLARSARNPSVEPQGGAHARSRPIFPVTGFAVVRGDRRTRILRDIVRGCAVAVFVVIAATASPATAGTAVGDCSQTEGPDRRIAGCSRIIATPRAPLDRVVWARESLGRAYRQKENLEQA